MWGAHVMSKVYGRIDGADDRDLQTRLQERLCPQLQQHPAGGDNLRRKRVDTTDPKYTAAALLKSASDEEALVQFAPVREGWLVKRGTHGLKIWRRRWVVLAGRKLWYASAPPPHRDPRAIDRALAQMELTAGTRVQECNDTTFVVIPEGDDGSEAWFFRAESLGERTAWLSRVRLAVQISSWWERMRPGRILGEGGFTVVQELEDIRLKETLAFKRILARKRKERDQAVMEADVLIKISTHIRHPNLMSVRKVYVEGNCLSILFPLCKGGDLFHHIVNQGPWSEAKAAVLIHKLAGALEALHQHQIVHLDVKPENILFDTDCDDAEPKLSDFGLSRMMNVSGTVEDLQSADDWDAFSQLRYGLEYDEALNGSIGYMAPEVVQSRRYGPAADVWALGVVLYTVLSGSSPFQGADLGEVLQKSSQGEYTFSHPPIWSGISSGAKNLIRRMLTVDEHFRIPTRDIQHHPWIMENAPSTSTPNTAARCDDGQTEAVSEVTLRDSFSLSVDVRGLISSSWSSIIQSPILRNSFLGRHLTPRAAGEPDRQSPSPHATKGDGAPAQAVTQPTAVSS